ncbi:hypothetical protein FBZ89_11429 [Nitrospirillum amazonense]|uniref:Uncharacterized protein n=1 Tax=Nitrospirillum amazonense TaxID=28077 RepID=A0A560F1E9_9PROT|nr:hypothetical protein FBZ89_11429 [Nitrospirillum amazonense]
MPIGSVGPLARVFQASLKAAWNGRVRPLAPSRNGRQSLTPARSHVAWRSFVGCPSQVAPGGRRLDPSQARRQAQGKSCRRGRDEAVWTATAMGSAARAMARATEGRRHTVHGTKLGGTKLGANIDPGGHVGHGDRRTDLIGRRKLVAGWTCRRRVLKPIACDGGRAVQNERQQQEYCRRRCPEQIDPADPHGFVLFIPGHSRMGPRLWKKDIDSRQKANHFSPPGFCRENVGNGPHPVAVRQRTAGGIFARMPERKGPGRSPRISTPVSLAAYCAARSRAAAAVSAVGALSQKR